jgi:hypothetical protein
MWILKDDNELLLQPKEGSRADEHVVLFVVFFSLDEKNGQRPYQLHVSNNL